MSTWFTKNLGDPMLADAALEQIKALFDAEVEKSGNPVDMAVLFRHESEGRLQCELTVYFSPAAATVAGSVDAVSCQRPSPGDLGLLAGSADCWSALFPEIVP